MKVNYARSGSQSGPGPTRNRGQHGTGPIQRMLGTTPWPGPGLGQLCLAPVPALKSCSGSAVSGSPSPQKSPPRATGSRDPPESSSHAQGAGEGAPVRPEGAGRAAALTAARKGHRRSRSPGPRLQSGLPAARARAHSPRAAAAAVARGHGRSGPPPPLRASASGPPRARRAASPPGPAPGPPRALTPPVGTARRARLGLRGEAFAPRGRHSRPGSGLSSARAPPGTPGSASALADHVQRFRGAGGGGGGGGGPPGPVPAPLGGSVWSAPGLNSSLPPRSSPAEHRQSRDPVDEATSGIRNVPGTCVSWEKCMCLYYQIIGLGTRLRELQATRSRLLRSSSVNY